MLASGLFRFDVMNGRGDANEDESGGEKEYRMVAKGYYKFFHIGGVPWTVVRAFSRCFPFP